MGKLDTAGTTRRDFCRAVFGSLASLASAQTPGLREEALQETTEKPQREAADRPGTREFEARLEEASRETAAGLIRSMSLDGNPNRKSGYIDTRKAETEGGSLGCAAAISYYLLTLGIPLQGEDAKKIRVFLSTNELGDALNVLCKQGYLRKLTPGETAKPGDVVNARTDKQGRKDYGHVGVCAAMTPAGLILCSNSSSSRVTTVRRFDTGAATQLKNPRGKCVSNYTFASFSKSYDNIEVYRICKVPKVEQHILAKIEAKYKDSTPQKD